MVRDHKQFRKQARRTFDKDAAALVLTADDYARRVAGSRVKRHRGVAELLLQQQADPIVVAAALLVPLRRQARLAPAEIRARFGPEIAELVERVIGTPSLRKDTTQHHRADVSRLLDAMSSDIRVAILRLGLRIVDLQDGASGDDPALYSLAQESLDLYAPLAARLGMAVLCEELQDVCFRILEPGIHAELARLVGPIRREDEVCVEMLRDGISRLLKRNDITAQVHGRVKSLYSLYRKMQRRQCSLSEVMDRVGLRVIVDSVPLCYTVLGLLHNHFCPIPGTFDDYIASPKANGYQSLHTCVYPVPSISCKPVEIQIRTRLMHQEAEFGVAAHWRYKSSTEARLSTGRQRAWLQGLKELNERLTDPEDFLAQLRSQVYGDQILVFGEHGRRMRLPAGSTVRDFAQQVGVSNPWDSIALVNGAARSASYRLEDGDTVELLEPGADATVADAGARNTERTSIRQSPMECSTVPDAQWCVETAW